MSPLQSRVRRLFSRDNLPRSRAARIALGASLVLLGLVGFLPILGFWMVPLGLAILAIDVPIVRRFTRRARVAIGRWWKARQRARRAQPDTHTQAAAYLRAHGQQDVQRKP